MQPTPASYVLLTDHQGACDILAGLAKAPVATKLHPAAEQAMDALCARKLCSGADLSAAALAAMFPAKALASARAA